MCNYCIYRSPTFVRLIGFSWADGGHLGANGIWTVECACMSTRHTPTTVYMSIQTPLIDTTITTFGNCYCYIEGRTMCISYSTEKREGDRLEIYTRELYTLCPTRCPTISGADGQLSSVYICMYSITI